MTRRRNPKKSKGGAGSASKHACVLHARIGVRRKGIASVFAVFEAMLNLPATTLESRQMQAVAADKGDRGKEQGRRSWSWRRTRSKIEDGRMTLRRENFAGNLSRIAV